MSRVTPISTVRQADDRIIIGTIGRSRYPIRNIMGLACPAFPYMNANQE
ncbi:hypothetical protein [uncultured Thiodictyon sp.]|nr:hypothetical protein [uncultured Thiodictyon sp.]